MTTTTSPIPSDRRSPVGRAAWARSVPRAVSLLLHRRIRLRQGRVGQPLTVSDGHTFVPFRETVAIGPRRTDVAPAVLQPRFRLRGMGRPGSLRHRLFWRVCIVTIPFFVGLDGFRSKLWMHDPATGDYAGLYDWDDPIAADSYAQGLCRVLRLLSVPGSVSYELAENLDVDGYLRRHGPAAVGTPLAS